MCSGSCYGNLEGNSIMSIFRRKSLNLTKPTATYKGQYLGNVTTNLAKGDNCTDKPLGILWSNYVKTAGKQTVSMKITVDNSGLKVFTQAQGQTHYWCHRVSYFTVPPSHPKLFLWIYRHVGKKLKVELRCHAILLTSEKKANAMVTLLAEKVAISLQEYRREKAQRHRRRLIHEKAAAHLTTLQGVANSRTKLLSPSKNYKPPPEYSITPPGLSAISEETLSCSDPESDYCESSYSTIGRWTLKSKSDIPPNEDGTFSESATDINMYQLEDDDSDYESAICNGDDDGYVTNGYKFNGTHIQSVGSLLHSASELLQMETVSRCSGVEAIHSNCVVDRVHALPSVDNLLQTRFHSATDRHCELPTNCVQISAMGYRRQDASHDEDSDPEAGLVLLTSICCENSVSTRADSLSQEGTPSISSLESTTSSTPREPQWADQEEVEAYAECEIRISRL